MNSVVALLLFAVFSNIEAFPIAGSKTFAKQEQHKLFSSSKDGVPENAHTSDTETANKKDTVDQDTEALSGLLNEMFQAKLEMSRETKELESLASQNSDMPVLGNDGIYRIISQNQLENFKAAHSDKLVFLKFSSPICAACRMLKQKFQTLHRSPKFSGVPVVFADIVISNNKRIQDPFRDYITSQLQVRRVPSIHFYANGSDALANQIYCDDDGGCSWPKIQQQMLDFIGQHYTATPTPNAMHDASSTTTAIATTGIQSSATKIATMVAPRKSSKLKLVLRFLSTAWLR